MKKKRKLIECFFLYLLRLIILVSNNLPGGKMDRYRWYVLCVFVCGVFEVKKICLKLKGIKLVEKHKKMNFVSRKKAIKKVIFDLENFLIVSWKVNSPIVGEDGMKGEGR